MCEVGGRNPDQINTVESIMYSTLELAEFLESRGHTGLRIQEFFLQNKNSWFLAYIIDANNMIICSYKSARPNSTIRSHWVVLDTPRGPITTLSQYPAKSLDLGELASVGYALINDEIAPQSE